MPSTPPIKVPIIGEDKYSKEFKKMMKTADMMGRKVQSAGRALTVGLTAPLTMIGIAGVKMSKELNAAMANVGTLIPGESRRLQNFRKEVMDLGVATATNFDVVSEGLYETLSAFGTVDDPMNKLTLATKMAKAGLSTVKDSLGLVSAVTKGYGVTTDEAAQRVADMAFLTVKLGQTTFPELAASMGKVVPLAATLKVSQTELFGAMATLTGVTGNAAMVSTQLQSALGSFITPSTDMTKAAKKLGFESSVAMVKELGLAGSIRKLGEFTGGSEIKLGELITRKEGLNAALTLLGPQAANFAEKTLEMGKAAGATEAAFNAQTKGINKAGFAWDQGIIKIKKFLIILGDRIMPVIAKFIDRVTPFLDRMTGLSDATLDWGLKTAVAAAALGPLLVLLGKGISLAAGLASAISGAGGLAAVLAAVTGPVGLAVGAGAALVAIFIACQDETKRLRDAIAGPFMTLINDVREGFDSLSGSGGNLGDVLKSIVRVYSDMIAPVASVALKLALIPVKTVTTSFRIMAPVVRIVTSAVGALVRLVQSAVEWFGDLWDSFTEGTMIGRGIAAVFGAIGDAVGSVWDFIKGLWDTTGGFFADLANWLDSIGVKLDMGPTQQEKNVARYGPYEPGLTEPGMSYDTDLLYRMEQSRESEARITVDFRNLPAGAEAKVTGAKGAKVKARDRGPILEGAV